MIVDENDVGYAASRMPELTLLVFMYESLLYKLKQFTMRRNTGDGN
jgi:hypothetical protein